MDFTACLKLLPIIDQKSIHQYNQFHSNFTAIAQSIHNQNQLSLLIQTLINNRLTIPSITLLNVLINNINNPNNISKLSNYLIKAIQNDDNYIRQKAIQTIATALQKQLCVDHSQLLFVTQKLQNDKIHQIRELALEISDYLKSKNKVYNILSNTNSPLKDSIKIRLSQSASNIKRINIIEIGNREKDLILKMLNKSMVSFQSSINSIDFRMKNIERKVNKIKNKVRQQRSERILRSNYSNYTQRMSGDKWQSNYKELNDQVRTMLINKELEQLKILLRGINFDILDQLNKESIQLYL